MLVALVLTACGSDDEPRGTRGDAVSRLDGGPIPTINIGYQPVDGLSGPRIDAGSGVQTWDAGPAHGETASDADAPALDAGVEGEGATLDASVASGPVCALPSTFHWQASGPLIAPKSPAGHDFVSIKDPTVVYWNNRFHVYATVYDRTAKAWNMVYLNFTDWSQANSAPQFYMANSPIHTGAGPQLFYFTPKKKWILVYQWSASFSMADDPSKPQTWSTPAPLLSDAPADAIDFWVICDSTNCHLFFANGKGQLFQATMPIERFPSAFSNAKVVLSDSASNLFGATNVFKPKGASGYLLLMEAYSPRFLRAWTATTLDGPWTPLAATKEHPFAGKANVSFAGANWSDDFGQGDMVRSHPDETMSIDVCNLQFVFQGADPKASTGGDDNLIPYRLGVLTPSP